MINQVAAAPLVTGRAMPVPVGIAHAWIQVHQALDICAAAILASQEIPIFQRAALVTKVIQLPQI